MSAGRSLAEVEALARRCNRWGRWGAEDQLGALNFIDEKTVAHAARSVRHGRVISCALPYDAAGPQTGHLGRTNPQHHMLQDGGDIILGAQDHLAGLRYADDAISMPLQCGTHWDAFSHIFYAERMFNGFGVEHVTSGGARRGALETMREKLVGRGVLLDVARFHGVDALDDGHAIDADQLSGCAAQQGTELRRGDILLVRTGQLARAREAGWGAYAGGDAPGLALASAEFVCEHEVAAIATDTWGCEVRPNETEAIYQPLHVVLLVNAGVIFGEMFDLEALARDCAADGVYDFLLVAAPLPFTGAVGGPLNPIAIK